MLSYYYVKQGRVKQLFRPKIIAPAEPSKYIEMVSKRLVVQCPFVAPEEEDEEDLQEWIDSQIEYYRDEQMSE